MLKWVTSKMLWGNTVIAAKLFELCIAFFFLYTLAPDVKVQVQQHMTAAVWYALLENKCVSVTNGGVCGVTMKMWD